MKLYNTLNRKKEDFTPISDQEARMYACGLTVYNFAHIGNLRAYLFEDVLRRVLEFNGFKVLHGMNVTDVGHLVGDGDEGEDKLEVGARREKRHPLEIARKYEEAFFEDLRQLNVELPHKVVRATESIVQQIEVIKLLVEKGFTYQDEAAIYFDTSKLADYGKLTGQKLEDKLVGAREDVVVDTSKRNPSDFVLWFFLVGKYKDHILHWPSPWGEGFPGWHIECSAISRSILGQPFDIHTGGVDHIGTHHTNEIAQSEVAFGVPLSNYWLHSEHLLVDGQKMSKSIGNVYTLKELEEKGFSPLDFRYFVLGAHYRSRLNFTWEALTAAKNARGRLMRLVEDIQENSQDMSVNQNYLVKFTDQVNDDLDTVGSLVVVWEMLRDDSIDPKEKLGTLSKMDEVLGLELFAEKLEKIPNEIGELASKRQKARQEKDFLAADQLRDEIAERGWIIEDTAIGYKLTRK